MFILYSQGIVAIEINRACRLNLLVVLAACNGIHLIKVATQLDRAPFWAVIGPESEVTAGAVERDFGEFYDELFETLDGDAALKALNKHSAGSRTYKFVNVRDIFIKAYAGYYKKHCVGKGKQRRKEKLLTSALQSPPIRTMGTKLVRQLVRQGLSMKNEEQHFNKMRDDFFFVDSFPENTQRFSLSYQDVLVQAGLQ